MTHENENDPQVDVNSPNTEDDEGAETLNDNQMPTSWRIAGIGIALLALVIVAVLVWPREDATINTSDAVDTQNETSNQAPAAAENDTTITETDSPEALFQIGEAFYQNGEWQQAINAYQKAIELNPEYDAAYTNLGSTYYRNGQLDQAIEAYQSALDLAPSDADTHHNLGMVYLQLWLTSTPQEEQILNQALDQINEAISLEPGLPAPHYGLGVIYQVQGDIPKAVEAFEKFLELDDNSDPTATTNATQILEQLRAQQ